MDDQNSYEPRHGNRIRRTNLQDALFLNRNRFINDPEEQQNIFGEILKAAEEHWEAAYHTGILFADGLYTEKEPQKAYRAFLNALNLCPEIGEYQADIHTALGYCYMNGFGIGKNREKAISHFQTAVHLDEDPMALLLLSDLYREQGVTEFDAVKSVRLFQRMLRGWRKSERSSTPDWRISLYIESRIVRSELYEEPAYHPGYHKSEEDREVHEMEAYRFMGIATDLIDISEDLKEAAENAASPAYREEYKDLQKDLRNALGIYRELDPGMEILKEEGAYYLEYIRSFITTEVPAEKENNL
ncbi:MAG: SEL1-like repeat protein [Erysipelotrichaceae bacterium]|nr:SEL1-like repeat protein [Erysipelotrichaceae bacterium]